MNLKYAQQTRNLTGTAVDQREVERWAAVVTVRNVVVGKCCCWNATNAAHSHTLGSDQGDSLLYKRDLRETFTNDFFCSLCLTLRTNAHAPLAISLFNPAIFKKKIKSEFSFSWLICN